jgi:hypothetical protein
MRSMNGKVEFVYQLSVCALGPRKTAIILIEITGRRPCACVLNTYRQAGD